MFDPHDESRESSRDRPPADAAIPDDAVADDDVDRHDGGDDGPDVLGPGLRRRRFLRGAGLGAAALFGGGVAGGVAGFNRAAGAGSSTPGSTGHDGHAGLRIYDAGAPGGAATAVGGTPGTPGAAGHGHGVHVPADLAADQLDHVTVPPRPGTQVGTHTFDVVETSTVIAEGITVDQWTYDGHVPGPILRATEGDVLRITLRNRTSHDHNLHFHGRHSPGMDGWEPIPPGAEFTYEIVAGPAGLHPYHCHTSPLARHIAMGLYGLLIVDPVEPRTPAHEYVLLLSGWDTDGDGSNEVYTYNGIAGFFHRFPLKVPIGELVRVYVANMVEHEPLASFHLHAQTFDVFRSGAVGPPQEHTDTVTMSQAERAVIEFRLPEQGRYMFHPHQHHMAEAGAMGWFAAI